MQPGGRLESLQRTAFDLAGEQQEVELAQGGAAIGRFEIVVGSEQALTAGLALALGDGAQRVEPAGDGRQEALLGLHIGGNRPEQGRLRLVGPVAAPQALDGRIRLPARLQQIVNAQALVPGCQGRRDRSGPVPPASLKTRMRLSSSMKACASARLAEPGAVLDAEPVTLAHDPA